MRKAVIVFGIGLSVVFVAAGPSLAGVTILSGEQHIWGGASYSNITGDPPQLVTVQDSYDSGVVPWDGSLLSDGAQVYPGVFSYGEIGGLHASVESKAWSPDVQSSGAGVVAEGTWTFRPDGDTIIVVTDFDLWNIEIEHLLIELTDLTSAEQVYYLRDEYGLNHDYMLEGPLEEVLPADPAHEYRLDVYLHSSANDDGPWYGLIEVRAPVPAPGAALLGLLGAGLVGRLRRRRAV